MAVHVSAFGGACVLCRELAEVIHHEEGTFANYTFDSWRKRSDACAPLQAAARGLDSRGQFRDPGPAGDSPADLRSPAEAGLRLNRRNVLARDGQPANTAAGIFPSTN